MSECVFCKIIAKQIPARIEEEDAETVAFYDVNPQAPVHLLIIPRKHIDKIGSLEKFDADSAGKLILKARDIAAKKGWQDYRLVFNNGIEAGQTVFHIHLHLLSGRRMNWPPG